MPRPKAGEREIKRAMEEAPGTAGGRAGAMLAQGGGKCDARRAAQRRGLDDGGT